VNKNPSKKRRPVAALLTLTCIGSLVPLFLTYVFGPQSGLESLILIVPLMATVATHVLLGPVALFISWRESDRLMIIFIWFYFFLFASISFTYWAVVNEIPLQARTFWREFTRPEDAELSKRIRDRETSTSETINAVKTGADVDHITPEQRTPLMEAVIYNRPEVAKVLLESGADPNQAGAEERTPLFLAAINLQAEITKLLLDGGADPNQAVKKDSPLCRVLRTVAMAELPPRQEELVKLLIDAGADGSGGCGRPGNMTTYQMAVGYGMRSVVTQLVNADHKIPKTPNHVDYGTALTEAVKRNQAEWLQILLKAGISTDAPSQSGRLPLEIAIGGGKLELVQSLLVAGADPKLRPYAFQITRLSDDRADLLKIILDASASVDDGAGGKGGALYQAAHNGRLEQVKLLLQAGAKPNALNPKGIPLVIALQRRPVSNEKRQIIMTLLEAGATPNVWDDRHRTALMIAVQRSDVQLAEALFQAGAIINAQDPEGRTAAHLASELYDAEEIINWLHQGGADFSLKDQSDSTPLCLALAKPRNRALKAILATGAPITDCGADSASAFWSAVSRRDIDALRLLIDHGVKPDGQGKNGISALEEAARRGFMDGFNLLLSAGADPNIFVQSGYALKPNADFGRAPWRYPAKRSTPRVPLPLVTAALLGGYEEALNSLLQAGANPTPLDSNGNTPLLALAMANPGTIDVYGGVQRLIKTAGTHQAYDVEGFTATTRAAINDRLPLLAAFAKGGLDINMEDAHGRKVVEILAENSHQAQRLKELLDLGLKVTPEAQAIALKRGNSYIIKVLTQ
jgi:ankyrin repeat protein